jgi:hypothetical protein
MIEFGVKSLPSVAQGGGGFPDHEPTPESGPVAHQFYSVKTAFHFVKQAPPARPDGLPLRGSPVATRPSNSSIEHRDEIRIALSHRAAVSRPFADALQIAEDTRIGP